MLLSSRWALEATCLNLSFSQNSLTGGDVDVWLTLSHSYHPVSRIIVTEQMSGPVAKDSWNIDAWV